MDGFDTKQLGNQGVEIEFHKLFVSKNAGNITQIHFWNP